MIKKFSAISGSVSFDPARDVFRVDNAELSASGFSLSSPTADSTKFVGGGKSITLLTTPIIKLGRFNVTFEDGSRLRVGDDAFGGDDDQLANFLLGTSHGDQLVGLAGDDTLNGRAGADKLVGGAGDDTYVVDDIADSVVERVSEGRDLVRSSVTYTLRANVDDLTLTGTDPTGGTGNGDNNVITGNSGNNALAGRAGGDHLIGGAGDDTLQGNRGHDLLEGGSGADVLVYDFGDQINGGTGNDTLRVDAASLDLGGKAGDELVSIEAIDLANAAGSLALTKDDVLALSSTGTLLLKGDGHDAVWFGTGWSHSGTTVDPLGETGSYTVWIQDGATLMVGSEIAIALQLSTLDGTNGFRLDGIDANDRSGRSVASAGDVNGDGFDDLIVGAYRGDAGGFFAGESYVVFGAAGGLGSAIDLGALDGTDGFRLVGRSVFDRSGGAVAAAGDVNGDGYADLIIGAEWGRGGTQGGESYVVFGTSSGFGSELNLGALNGLNGFRLEGIERSDRSGHSVATAGDVNGDGFADLIIGAPSAEHGGGFQAGESYVVFGAASGFGSALQLSSLDGANGFRLDGFHAFRCSGSSVASAGDVNGDGFDDVIVGAFYAADDRGAGESYVVFGAASGFAATLDLGALNGANGFRLDGIEAYDGSGFSVASAGDVNGDGIADLIVGAPYANDGAGEACVVFGKASGFGSALDLAILDGANGFRLNGVDRFDVSGSSVASAGDVNGDGYDDLIVGAPGGAREGPFAAGESYVVFGAESGFGSALDLGSLDGVQGFRLGGIDAHDYSGSSVASAGDVNGDGFDDLILGAYGADAYAGESYIVYGGDFTGAAGRMGTSDDDTLTGAGGAEVIRGGAGDDRIRVPDLDFFRIDGGLGNDTLVLVGSGLDFDFSALDGNAIRGMENIQLGGRGNTLTLSALDVLNLSDTSNLLTVHGTRADTVDLRGEAWVLDHSLGGLDYYEIGGATLGIDADIAVLGPT